MVHIFQNAASNSLATMAGNLVKSYGKDGLTLSQSQQLIGDTLKIMSAGPEDEETFFIFAGKVLGSSKFMKWWIPHMG